MKKILLFLVLFLVSCQSSINENNISEYSVLEVLQTQNEDGNSKIEFLPITVKGYFDITQDADTGNSYLNDFVIKDEEGNIVLLKINSEIIKNYSNGEFAGNYEMHFNNQVIIGVESWGPYLTYSGVGQNPERRKTVRDHFKKVFNLDENYYGQFTGIITFNNMEKKYPELILDNRDYHLETMQTEAEKVYSVKEVIALKKINKTISAKKIIEEETYIRGILKCEIIGESRNSFLRVYLYQEDKSIQILEFPSAIPDSEKIKIIGEGLPVSKYWVETKFLDNNLQGCEEYYKIAAESNEGEYSIFKGILITPKYESDEYKLELR